MPMDMDDDQYARDRAAVARAFLHADHTPAQPATQRRGSGGGSSSTSSGEFRGREFFKTPDLDQRMKKYLVRLANETANHLIRDTLEPEHTSLVWKPVTTVKGIEIFRGYERSHADAVTPVPGRDGHTSPAGAHSKDATCLRGVACVNATIEEFAMVFKLDTNKRLAEHGLLFNPDLLDMSTLYSLVQPSGDHPRRYVGIKWCLVQSPSRIFRNRDFCYLECQKEFRDAQGRRGWVRSMHSIKMPCCPTLEKSHGIVRASLYRCGLIAVETDKPGVLDTTYTIEMDLKGHFPEIFQPAFLRQRIVALASIDKYLQQQRLSSSPLLGDLDIPATKVKGACHFCFREFSTFNRRHICRKCGEGVCKHCSDDWMLDIPVIGRKKVRICTVCSAEARYCHATPMSARQTFSTALNAALESETVPIQTHDIRDQTVAPAQRQSRSLSMSNAYESSNAPFVQTARDRQQSMHRASSFSHDAENMKPSEYFATQYYQHQYEQPRDRRRTVSSRASDYSAEFEDLHNNAGIRGTADLTGLWDGNDFNDQSPIYSYKRPTRNEYPTSNPTSHATPARRNTLASEGGMPYASQRSRAPTASTDQSHRTPDHGRQDHSFEPNRGHFPPSSRYTIVGNRLERANSFDAARHLEEQQSKQQRHNDYQQSIHNGNSRRSPQQIFDRPRRYQPSSPSPSPNARRGSYYTQQHYDDARTNSRPSHHQPHFTQPAPTTSRVAGPPNIALDFVRNMQQAQHPPPPPPPVPAPVSAMPNVALEFVRHMQQPQPPVPTTQFAPMPQVPFIKFDPPKVQFQPNEPEPPQSPELGGETIEYIESESGEWIASNRWEKGVLDVPPFDLTEGEPLETRFCDNCGAKQYVHEGVVEATCDCDTDDYGSSPAQMEGFRSDSDLRLSSASVHSDTPHDASSVAIQLAVDIDKVVPLLVERLSRQSLGGSFQNSPPLV